MLKTLENVLEQFGQSNCHFALEVSMIRPFSPNPINVLFFKRLICHLIEDSLSTVVLLRHNTTHRPCQFETRCNGNNDLVFACLVTKKMLRSVLRARRDPRETKIQNYVVILQLSATVYIATGLTNAFHISTVLI